MSKLEDEYLDFRKLKDEFFAEDQESPLSPGQKADFKGLNYFPVDPSLRLKVKVELIEDSHEFKIPTSTGSYQTYRRFGRFKLSLEGQESWLTIYADEDSYFLPFVDSLAGKETYPAGRYLEPEPLPDGRFQIDFNLAYNPYCAYNEMWSCPLTPAENRLKVAIRAGEKIFHEE
jgi:uncharacterized protein (DUF1684 family)